MDISRSLVSVEHEFVLWWHHKAACTLMKTWFATLLGMDVQYNPGPEVNHQSVHNLTFPRYNATLHRGYYHFTVVRNPRARLASIYRQQVSKPVFNVDSSRPLIRQTYSSFREFIGVVCSTPEDRLEVHRAPLWPVMKDVPLDAVVHVERLETEWPPVAKRIGVDHIPLPELPIEWHMPKTEIAECCADWPAERFIETGLRPPWKSYYDDTLRAITQFKFAEDLEHWYHMRTPFDEEASVAHTRGRQAHLASLGLPLEDKRVLEVGAGVGHHTGFWVNRGCKVTAIDVRDENIAILKEDHPNATVIKHNLDAEEFPPGTEADIVYAYGVLYHLTEPARALEQWASVCKEMLLLETCVTGREDEPLWKNDVYENVADPRDNPCGWAYWPSREFVVEELNKHFEFVYVPVTQPDLADFPLDWSLPQVASEYTRAIFVASKTPLDNPLLLGPIRTPEELPEKHLRFGDTQGLLEPQLKEYL